MKQPGVVGKLLNFLIPQSRLKVRGRQELCIFRTLYNQSNDFLTYQLMAGVSVQSNRMT